MKATALHMPLAFGKSMSKIFAIACVVLTSTALTLNAQPVSHEMVIEAGDTTNGDPIELLVYLGTQAEPVSSTSHIIFSFPYDPDTYDPSNALSLDLGNSFFIQLGNSYNASVWADEVTRLIHCDIENLSENGSGWGGVARVTGGLLVVADIHKGEGIPALARDASDKEMQVYPTIASNQVSIALPTLAGGALQVVDVQGRVVGALNVAEGVSEVKFPTGELTSGMYKVRMAAEDAAGAMTGSFIKK